MKNLFNIFKGKKSVQEETKTVQTKRVSEFKVVIGVFKVSDGNITRFLEGVYYDYPMMKTFVSKHGALVSTVEVELVMEVDIDNNYTPEMAHALECIENQWAMRFYQLADIA